MRWLHIIGRMRAKRQNVMVAWNSVVDRSDCANNGGSDCAEEQYRFIHFEKNSFCSNDARNNVDLFRISPVYPIAYNVSVAYNVTIWIMSSIHIFFRRLNGGWRPNGWRL